MDNPTAKKATKAEKPEEKPNPRAIHWAFTLNNYEKDDCYKIRTHPWVELYSIGFEIGENKTPHLQGYVKIKTRKRIGQMKEINYKAHWEKCDNILASINYTQKDGNYIQNTSERRIKKIPETLRPWQQKLFDIVKCKEPEDRKIYWIYDELGNTGKTSFIKYCIFHLGHVKFTTCTKSADILTVADPNASAYLINFTRTTENFAPYMAVEQLSDGLISDGKLKKMAINMMTDPNLVMIFANWRPNYNTISADRWVTMHINRDQQIEIENLN